MVKVTVAEKALTGVKNCGATAYTVSTQSPLLGELTDPALEIRGPLSTCVAADTLFKEVGKVGTPSPFFTAALGSLPNDPAMVEPVAGLPVTVLVAKQQNTNVSSFAVSSAMTVPLRPVSETAHPKRLI